MSTCDFTHIFTILEILHYFIIFPYFPDGQVLAKLILLNDFDLAVCRYVDDAELNIFNLLFTTLAMSITFIFRNFSIKSDIDKNLFRVCIYDIEYFVFN